MTRSWLTGITYGIAALAAAFILFGLFFSLGRPTSIPPKEPIKERTTLLPGAFDLHPQAYDAIGEPILNLKTQPVSMQVPDLRTQLLFTGKNNRPDAKQEKLLLHFTLPGSKQPLSIAPNEKLYIFYDRKQNGGKWAFTPNNAESSLWIVATPRGEEVDINLEMRNEKGQIVQQPSQFTHFSLKAKEQIRNGKTWEMGKWRVDATLLSRQKARWYGKDLFLEKHGGEEFAQTVGKERIDFIEGDTPYSIYVKPDDLLVWKGERWIEVKPGDETATVPLLVVKKIGDRVMNLELWDVEGKRKVSLNLLKSGDVKVPQGLLQQFKFAGAKTRSQFLFEVGKERMTLRPKDWLVFTKEGWKKLTTPEEIDDFVFRKTTGPLFILDRVVRKGDSQVLIGTLFNSSRTEMQQIEIPLQQGRPTKVVEEEKAPTNNPQKPPPRPPQAARPRQNGERRVETKEREKVQLQPPRQREPRMQNGKRMPLTD